MTRISRGVLALCTVISLVAMSQLALAAACALPNARVVPPISDRPWLPDDRLPPRTADSQQVQLHGVHGQHLSASILLRGTQSARLSVTGGLDLPGGHFVPVDVRYVKVWYQGKTAWRSIHHQPGRTLVPELLLRDDALVQVDLAKADNRIRVMRDGRTEYLYTAALEKTGIRGDKRRMPVDKRQYTILDAAETVPLELPPSFTKQLWLQFILPTGTPAGSYTGKVVVSCGEATGLEIPVSLQVHDFDLKESSIRYGVYYRGILHSGDPQITSERKTKAQMRTDLQAIYDLGVRYPTLYQSLDDPIALAKVLDLRNELGFPDDEVYYLGAAIGAALQRNDTRVIRDVLRRSTALFASKGYQRLVFYAVDEGSAKVIAEQLPGWAQVQASGNEVMVAGRKENLARFPDAADIYVAAYAPERQFADRIHEHGRRVYAYASPQGGVENPHLFRQHYGLELWQAQYDGALIYAYQDMRGVAWSDFDGRYRDHFLVYPTTTGYIPTLAWEGLREAIYDVRYLETLQAALAGSPDNACQAENRAYRAGRVTLQAAFQGAYPTLDKMRTAVAGSIDGLVAARRQCELRPSAP